MEYILITALLSLFFFLTLIAIILFSFSFTITKFIYYLMDLDFRVWSHQMTSLFWMMSVIKIKNKIIRKLTRTTTFQIKKKNKVWTWQFYKRKKVNKDNTKHDQDRYLLTFVINTHILNDRSTICFDTKSNSK